MRVDNVRLHKVYRSWALVFLVTYVLLSDLRIVPGPTCTTWEFLSSPKALPKLLPFTPSNQSYAYMAGQYSPHPEEMPHPTSSFMTGCGSTHPHRKTGNRIRTLSLSSVNLHTYLTTPPKWLSTHWGTSQNCPQLITLSHEAGMTSGCNRVQRKMWRRPDCPSCLGEERKLDCESYNGEETIQGTVQRKWPE